jgi:hypothetical protein
VPIGSARPLGPRWAPLGQAARDLQQDPALLELHRGQVSERFTEAIEQLSNSSQAEERIGGVYVLPVSAKLSTAPVSTGRRIGQRSRSKLCIKSGRCRYPSKERRRCLTASEK